MFCPQKIPLMAGLRALCAQQGILAGTKKPALGGLDRLVEL
jgi:hypothetical protein